MNERIFNLMLMLVSAPGAQYALSDLSAELRVSIRSVRNYVEAINVQLRSVGLEPLKTNASGQIFFNGTAEEGRQLIEKVREGGFYLYRLSAEERSQLIALIFLSTNDYVTLSELSDRLFVSRSTLIKDLETVKGYFAKYNIYFNPIKRSGYLLKVNEFDRRTRILRLLRRMRSDMSFLQSPSGAYKSLISDIFNFPTNIEPIMDLVHEAESSHSYYLTDTEYWMMTVSAAIVVYRLKMGFRVHSIPSAFSRPYNNELTALSEHFSSRLFKLFSLEPSEEEKSYILYLWNSITSSSVSPKDKLSDVELNIIVKNFLYNVSADLAVNLAGDEELQTFLVAHIRSVMGALRSGESNENIYKTQLEKEYPQYLTAVKGNIWILEKSLNYTYNEDDVSFILMHVAAAIQRQRQQGRAARIVVACNTGICTSNLLAEKLRREFNVDIVEITSTHRLKDVLKNVDCDLVLSTIPVSVEGVRCIEVSPVLSEENMITLHKVFSELPGNTEASKKPVRRDKLEYRWLLDDCRNIIKRFVPNESVQSALELLEDSFARLSGSSDPRKRADFETALPASCIKVNVQVDDWKDAVNTVGAILLKSGKVARSYIEATVNAVVEKGPYVVFVPGVAIIHASPDDGVLDFGMSFITLAQPVNFGNALNDPVKYILGVSVVDTQQCIDFVFHAMSMLCNPEVLTELDKVQNEEQVVEIFRKYEKDLP